MTKYRVVGYIPAGGHRMKLAERIVFAENENGAIRTWLGTLIEEGHTIGADYQVDIVEKISGDDRVKDADCQNLCCLRYMDCTYCHAFNEKRVCNPVRLEDCKTCGIRNECGRFVSEVQK